MTAILTSLASSSRSKEKGARNVSFSAFPLKKKETQWAHNVTFLAAHYLAPLRARSTGTFISKYIWKFSEYWKCVHSLRRIFNILMQSSEQQHLLLRVYGWHWCSNSVARFKNDKSAISWKKKAKFSTSFPVSATPSSEFQRTTYFLWVELITKGIVYSEYEYFNFKIDH